jgi:bifunctional DNA-binding transcriptional regulator/antitoxin component of YhaV-PrlF toxin-antitoxin module
MEASVTITPKFQVSIPVSIRKYLKMTKHGKAVMRARLVGKKQIIELVPDDSDILSLAGMFKGSKPVRPVDVDNIRDEVDYSKW